MQPGHEATRPGVFALTRREQEVLALVAEGLSNREIAARIVISPRTAQTCVWVIHQKLYTHNRVQLALYYWLQHGFCPHRAGEVWTRIQHGATQKAPTKTTA